MSLFTQPLQYVPLANGLYKISKGVRFYLNDDKTGEYIELVEGAITNFATIPNLAQVIFPHDHDDYKMPAAFHDGLVVEFGQQIWVMEDEKVKRIPVWQESAMWFRVMMSVRQRARRNKRVWWKKLIGIPVDFVTRWSFWSLVSIHGLVK